MQGFRNIKVPFTKEQLQEDYDTLKSTLKIATKYGVCKKYVLNHMKTMGVKIKPRYTGTSEHDVRKLAGEGKSSKEIAQILCKSTVRVNLVARKFGIKITDSFHPGYITKTHAPYIMIQCPDHPYKNKWGYVMEHRLVMEKYLGRYLFPEEVVHHIDGDFKNNKIENLWLFKNVSEHTLFHKKGHTYKRNSRARGDFSQPDTFSDR